jgi:hypothetical protein
MKDITFIYIVGGDEKHYLNLKRSIKSVKNIYPECNILVGDFNNQIDSSIVENLKVINLSNVNLDKSKTYKHIIWQYKYYISMFTSSRYNLYLDTDTVLVNPLDDLIYEAGSKFTIAQHFWVPTVKDFKQKAESNYETFLYLDFLGLKDEMKFCAAGVFFFEKNDTNLKIIKNTFDLHSDIYNNKNYILGVYDEPILNSVLQKNIKDIIYYNGSLNHCSMKDMPLELKGNTIYGKNNFDEDYKKVICLHCDFFRRDPSVDFQDPIKSLIFNLFNNI